MYRIKENGRFSLDIDEWTMGKKRYQNMSCHAHNSMLWNLQLVSIHDLFTAEKCVGACQEQLEEYHLDLESDIVCVWVLMVKCERIMKCSRSCMRTICTWQWSVFRVLKKVKNNKRTKMTANVKMETLMMTLVRWNLSRRKIVISIWLRNMAV